MVFHSVEAPLAQPEERHLVRKRNENYKLSLLKFDQMYFALPKYRLLFGEKTALWAKLMANRSTLERDTELSGVE